MDPSAGASLEGDAQPMEVDMQEAEGHAGAAPPLTRNLESVAPQTAERATRAEKGKGRRRVSDGTIGAFVSNLECDALDLLDAGSCSSDEEVEMRRALAMSRSAAEAGLDAADTSIISSTHVPAHSSGPACTATDCVGLQCLHCRTRFEPQQELDEHNAEHNVGGRMYNTHLYHSFVDRRVFSSEGRLAAPV